MAKDIISGAATILRGARTGSWLTRQRVIAYGAILLALEVVVFVFLIAGTHGWIVPLSKPTTTDFASFYAAGHLADVGTPQLAYHRAVHYAVEQQATAPGIPYQFFYYPPVFLLICALLGWLPYMVAFVLFEAATLLPYLLVARAILREREWAVLIPILAFPAVFWTLGLGQNAFITAALLGGACLTVDRRPVVGGMLFGALCYKPHFGLLVPVALAAGRQWRAFIAAAVCCGALVALSIALFGWASWHDFFVAAAGSHKTYETARIELAAIISPFDAVLLLGGSLTAAYVVQAMATLAAAGIVAYVWWHRLSLPLRSATLAAATTIAVPVMLIYDLMMAGVAIFWIVRIGRERGFLPWEKSGLVLLFALPLFTRSIGIALHLQLAPLIGIALLADVLLRARQERAVAAPVPRMEPSRLSAGRRQTPHAPV